MCVGIRERSLPAGRDPAEEAEQHKRFPSTPCYVLLITKIVLHFIAARFCPPVSAFHRTGFPAYRQAGSRRANAPRFPCSRPFGRARQNDGLNEGELGERAQALNALCIVATRDKETYITRTSLALLAGGRARLNDGLDCGRT